MVDYDLPMIDSDKDELLSKHLMVRDKENNELVLYQELLKDYGPKKRIVSNVELTHFVVKI